MLGIVKLRKFHEGPADLSYNMGITANSTWQSLTLRKLQGACCVLQQKSTRVENLDQIDVGHYLLQGVAAEPRMRPKAIEGVWNTHQPSLGFDPRYSLLGGEMGRDLFSEEETNDLSAAV